jgi:hypothetical protein
MIRFLLLPLLFAQVGGLGTLTRTYTGGALNPQIRCSNYQTFSSTNTVVVNIPSCAVAGDFAVLFFGNENAYSATPTGWAIGVNSCVLSSYYCGTTFTKVLTSGDISTGSVTIPTGGGPADGVSSMVDMTGNPSSFDAGVGVSDHAGTLNPITFTSQGLLGTDTLLIFCTNRGSGANTITPGTQIQHGATGGDAAGVVNVLYSTGSYPSGVSVSCAVPNYNPEGYYAASVRLRL